MTRESEIALLWPRRKIKLFEGYDGVALGPSHTVTDTETKLSVANSLLTCAGGKAAPAWDDPRDTWQIPFQIIAGTTLSWKVNCSAFGSTGGQFGFDTTNPVAKDLVPSFWLKAAPQVTSVAGTNITIPQTLVVGIEYELVLLFDGNGYAHYCIKTNIEKVLRRLYIGATDLRGARYLGFSNNDLGFTSESAIVRQGPIPVPWLVGAAPTHTFGYGAELLTDGALDNWASATDLTSWTETIAGTSTVTQENAVRHTASGSAARLDVDASGSLAQILQTLTVGAASWLRIIVWQYSSVSGKLARVNIEGVDLLPDLDPGTTWTRFLHTYRLVAANPVLTYKRASGVSASSSLYADDMSIKPITSGLYSLVGDPGTRNVIVDGNLTLTNPYSQKGMVIWADHDTAPTWGIWIYYNGNDGKMYADKMEAGVITNLFSAAVTYGAAKRFHVIPNGASLGVYYDNALCGTIQTVPEGQGYGTRVLDFSTEDTTGTAWGIWLLTQLATVYSGTVGCQAPMGQSGIYQCTPTITANEAGMDICFGDANNKLRVWHDGTNCGVKKILAGASSDVVAATAAAYGAARVLKCELQGQAAFLWYNGVYIGTGTITALGVALTGVGCQEHSSGAGASWGTFTLSQEVPA
jgi:hypothetical protein